MRLLTQAKYVEIAILIEPYHKSHVHYHKYHKALSLVDKFPNTNVYLWPPIFSPGRCPAAKSMSGSELGPNAKKPGFSRGLTIAHLEIWRDFRRRRMVSTKNDSSDALFIMEDDAECSVMNCGNITVSELQTFKSDIHFFGWCYKKEIWKPPMCTHAYAISISGINKLVDMIDPCGTAVNRLLFCFHKSCKT